MILSVIGFVVTIVVLLVFCYKTKIVYPVIMKIMGIIGIVFSALEYIVKVSGYSTKISFDYEIYIMLFNIKIGCEKIAAIGIIGICLFMTASLMLVYVQNRRKRIFFMLIPVGLFALINILKIDEAVYLKFLNLGYDLHIAQICVGAVAVFGVLLLAVLIIYPYLCIIKNYRESFVCKKKNDLLLSGAIWLAIDISSMLTVFVGGLHYYMFYKLDVHRFPVRIVRPDADNVTAVMIISIAVMILVASLIIKYTPLGKFFINKADDTECMHEKDESVFMIMHTYKNAFASILMYSNGDRQYEFLGAAETRLEMINKIASEQFEKLGQSMNNYRISRQNINMKNTVDLKKCVADAIEKSKIYFKVDTHFCEAGTILYGDEHHITESIVCVLNNAFDAVRNNPEGDMRIAVEIGTDEPYYYINVIDNGSGIKRKNLGKIFKPFYSTKRGGENYGLGLSYVKKITNVFGGNADIKSKEGKGTFVQMYFRTEEFFGGVKNGKDKSACLR